MPNLASKEIIIPKTNTDIHQYYDLSNSIGKGSYSSVILGTQKNTGHLRAIKCISKQHLLPDSSSENKYLSEFYILKQLDHPNIMKVYELYEDQSTLYIVTEYIPGGMLFAKLAHREEFSEAICAHILKQVVYALAYCHEKKIVHRDIKP